MRQVKSYGDERELAFCAYCGNAPSTRDHCPSRVLLDEPYPENLPVVGACETCNSSFSADEEYLACLIGSVLAGSTDPLKIERPKIRRILTEKPALRTRLEKVRTTDETGTIFQAEMQRVHAVATKLARGHAFYELHQPCREAPNAVEALPLTLMKDSELAEFENPSPESSSVAPWPEVGSRAMQRIISGEPPWIIVQEGLYRFWAIQHWGGVEVRMIINEYLACLVRWED